MKKIIIAVIIIFVSLSTCYSGQFETRIKSLLESTLGEIFKYESSTIDESGLVCIKAALKQNPEKKVILWANSSADLLIIGSVYNRQGEDLTIKEYNEMGGLPSPTPAKPIDSETIDKMQRNMQVMSELRKPKETQSDQIDSLRKVRAMFKDPEKFDALYKEILEKANRDAAKSDERIAKRHVTDPELIDWLKSEEIGTVNLYEDINFKNTVYIFSSEDCRFCDDVKKTIKGNLDKFKEKQVAVKWIPVVSNNTEEQIKKAALIIQEGLDLDPKKKYKVTEQSLKKAGINTVFFKSSFESHKVPVVLWASKAGIESISGFPSNKFTEIFIDTVANKGTIAEFVKNAIRLKKAGSRGNIRSCL